MWTAIITGLAALTGAFIGGLGTVIATHLTNKGAEKIARDQRLRDLREQRYTEAKNLLSEFLGKWWRAAYDSVAEQDLPLSMLELAVLGSRIQILMPDLEDMANKAVRNALEAGTADKNSIYSDFVAAAQVELKKLEPKV